MKPKLQQQFNQYSASHTNTANQAIHNIAVPLIYVCVLGLFWAIPTPSISPSWMNASHLAIAITFIFYLKQSLSLALGILILSALSIGSFIVLESLQISVLLVSTCLFILAWVAQFIGHHIEGKKPSFFDDLQFLLVGPGWVIAKLYRRLHIPL